MALLQPITLETGVIAGYWRIRRIIADYSQTSTALVELGGYPDRQTRLGGFEPVKIASYEINDIEPAEGEPDLRRGFYLALLKLPEFETAKSD